MKLIRDKRMKNKKMYYWKIRKWREELLKKVHKKLDKKRKFKLNLNKLRDKLHSKAKMLKLPRIKSNLQKLHHLVEVYHQKHLLKMKIKMRKNSHQENQMIEMIDCKNKYHSEIKIQIWSNK